MIRSSEEEETEVNQPQESKDGPMGETREDEPETKRRRIVDMIESITSAANDEGICLLCGNAGHSMYDCQRRQT